MFYNVAGMLQWAIEREGKQKKWGKTLPFDYLNSITLNIYI